MYIVGEMTLLSCPYLHYIHYILFFFFFFFRLPLDTSLSTSSKFNFLHLCEINKALQKWAANQYSSLSPPPCKRTPANNFLLKGEKERRDEQATGNSQLICTLQVTGRGGEKKKGWSWRPPQSSSDQARENKDFHFPEHHLNEVDHLYKLYIL